MTLRWKIAQWFEWHWWKNYLRDKDNGAYRAWKTDYWKVLIEKIRADINLAEASTIADLGCGPAGIFMIFPNNAVSAVDPLLDIYETQTSFFKKRDYPNIAFITSTIEDFSPAQKFDLVFCMNAINHVHDINFAFNQIKAVCKNNGALIVSIDAHNHGFFKHLFRTIPGDILHPHQYDLPEYTSLLAMNGWQVKTKLLLKHEFFFDHYVLVAHKLQPS